MNGNTRRDFDRAPARPTARCAFTLTELLVVLGVVSLLASLLLPALTGSKAESRRMQCVSNLRQMGIAAHLYVDDNEDTYAIAQYYDETGIFYCWDLTTIEGDPNIVIPG